MRADPDGAVELSEAIGRESEVDKLWSILPTKNLILSGRFGIGKTTVARLMIADAPTGWRGCYVPLAQASGAAQLRKCILESVGHDPDASETLRAAIGPTLDEAEPSAPEADPLTQSAIEHELDERNIGVVLALDDFDQFLANTLAAGGGAELSALLARLATLTGGGTRARLLLVSNTFLERRAALFDEGARALFSACARLQLAALRPEGGARLVSSLLLGESITARDRAALARALADNCDHVPRWIHCAMAHFVARGKPILDGDLERCMVEAVSELEREPWRLRQELAPVLDEYIQPQRGLALSILDQLALSEEQALTFGQIARQIAMETKIDDDALTRVVGELCGDQLIEELGGQLRFCGELLRMAWLKLRFM